MESDERLMALKKAYADIILNTAKEAAARIMVSEQKSLRFQHELGVAKEDALNMLLRLKHMMDSKINEAAMTSLNQQKKIEELEAQLHEAEDIVKDLREELRIVQTELERVMNNKLKHSDECEETLDESRLDTAHSLMFLAESIHEPIITACDMKNSTSDQKNEGHECCNARMQFRDTCKHELPSIIMRSKEPELYRNGCTQRIRALERNSLDDELSIYEQINNVKTEASAEKDEGHEGIVLTTAHEAENMCNLEKNVVHADSSDYENQGTKSLRSTRYKQNTEVAEGDQISDISCLKSGPAAVNSNAQSDEDLPEMTPRLPLDTTEIGTQLGCAEVIEREAEFVEAEDKHLPETVEVKREEIVSAENHGVLVCKIDAEKIEEPLKKSEPEPCDSTNEISSQPSNNRVIKYTFQRKRKRELPRNSDGNASLETSTALKKSNEGENGNVEPQKSSSISESSRESRRIAQVARQLLSLSKKKVGVNLVFPCV